MSKLLTFSLSRSPEIHPEGKLRGLPFSSAPSLPQQSGTISTLLLMLHQSAHQSLFTLPSPVNNNLKIFKLLPEAKTCSQRDSSLKVLTLYPAVRKTQTGLVMRYNPGRGNTHCECVWPVAYRHSSHSDHTETGWHPILVLVIFTSVSVFNF